MKAFFIILIFFIDSLNVFGQDINPTNNQAAVYQQNQEWDLSKYLWSQKYRFPTKDDKPKLDFDALDNWVSFGNNQDVEISPNGKYFTYIIKNQPYKNTTLVVQSIADARKQSFIGVNPGVFSDDSRFYIFKHADVLCFLEVESGQVMYIKGVTSYKQPETYKGELLAYYLKKDSTVVLRNLLTSNEKRFENISSYGFDKTGEWLACQSNNPERRLIVYNVITQREQCFKAVSGYSFNAYGNALVVKTVTRIKNGTFISLQHINLRDEIRTEVWSETENQTNIESYKMDSSGKQIVFIVQTLLNSDNYRPVSITANEQKSDTFKIDTSQKAKNQLQGHSVWYWKVGMKYAVQKATNEINSYYMGFGIQNAWFNDNGHYIMCTLEQRLRTLQPNQGSVKVDVWSYKDTIIQSAQPYLKQPKKVTIAIDPGGERIIPLWTDYERAKKYKGDFVVAAKLGKEIYGDRFWEKGYSIDSNWLISLRDGSRTLLRTTGNTLQSLFWFSPGSNYLIYFDLYQGCNYFSYNLHTGNLVNISAKIPSTSLGIGGEYMRPNKPTRRAGIAGWIDGDKGVLVYDNFDVWQLDLTGKRLPINLTNGYGRRHSIQMKLVGSSALDDVIGTLPVFQLSDTLLLKATNMVNRDNGFYRKVINLSADPEKLYMGACVMEMTMPSDYDQGMKPLKAKQVDVWIVKRQTASQAPNYFMTTDFKSYKALTNLQPQEKYNWLSSELHTFKQLDGTLSQGILYKPENFNPTKKYPVIIGFYEQFSRRLYQYLAPQYLQSPYIEIPWLVSHEYLVFTPDIYFIQGKWGPSTVNTVEGAAKYLSSLSFVDGDKIAATGHSNSGRFGYYLLTHSNRFTAMSVGAGTTNIISVALSLEKGGSQQSRLEWAEVTAAGTGMGNLWKNKNTWLDHASVLHVDKVTSPLLLFHNKNDGSFAAGQALEMYIGMRRLEKPVWWLQYDNGAHSVDGDDARDFTIRYTQFMDHYLKGAPAPNWMTKGIAAAMKGIETGYELDPFGSCSKGCLICQKINVDTSVRKTDN